MSGLHRRRGYHPAETAIARGRSGGRNRRDRRPGPEVHARDTSPGAQRFPVARRSASDPRSVSPTFTANATPGRYTVTASAPDVVTTAGFALDNLDAQQIPALGTAGLAALALLLAGLGALLLARSRG